MLLLAGSMLIAAHILHMTVEQQHMLYLVHGGRPIQQFFCGSADRAFLLGRPVLPAITLWGGEGTLQHMNT